MARKRLISPQFFLDGELFDAEQASGLPLRVAYAGLWCFADRRGYLEWKPRELKLGILPHDAVNMTDTMLALCSHGFLMVYEHPDHPTRLFVAIPSFPKWQTFNIKERPDPHIPSPLTKEHLTDTVPARFRHGASTPGTGTGTGTNSSTTSRVSRKQRAKPAGPVETWLTPACSAWEAANGAGTFAGIAGQAARALSPLRKMYSDDEIGCRLAFYLEMRGDPQGHDKAPARRGGMGWKPDIRAFALTFGHWNPDDGAAAA